MRPISMPGTVKSSAYLPRPTIFMRASVIGMGLPIVFSLGFGGFAVGII